MCIFAFELIILLLWKKQRNFIMEPCRKCLMRMYYLFFV